MAERCAERNRVKKLIRTVLKPAAANGIHIDQMNNIYEVMIGKTIPFRKFGFQSLEDFLKNSPDICRVVREIRGKYAFLWNFDLTKKFVKNE